MDTVREKETHTYERENRNKEQRIITFFASVTLHKEERKKSIGKTN